MVKFLETENYELINLDFVESIIIESIGNEICVLANTKNKSYTLITIENRSDTTDQLETAQDFIKNIENFIKIV